MSSTRPSSSRGRGRGKFKDNSPTPSYHQSNQHVQVIQPEEKKSEKQIQRSQEKQKLIRDPVKQSRTRNKKPEIQVYVPKGRRLLQEQQQHEQQQQRDQGGGDDGGESSNVEDKNLSKISVDMGTYKNPPHTGDGIGENGKGCQDVQNELKVSQNQTLRSSDNVDNVPHHNSDTDNKVGRKPRGKNQVYIPPYRRHCTEKQINNEEGQNINEVEIDDSEKTSFVQPSGSDSNDQIDNISSKRTITASPSTKNVFKRPKKKDFIESKNNVAIQEKPLSNKNSQCIPSRDLTFVEDTDVNSIHENHYDFWKNKDNYLFTNMNTKISSSVLEPEIDDGTAEYLRNEYLQAIGGSDFNVQKNLFYKHHHDINNKIAGETCEEEADDNGMVQEIDLDDIEIHSQEDVSVDKTSSLFNESKNSTEKQSEYVDSISIEGSDDENEYALCSEELNHKTHDNSKSESRTKGVNKVDSSDFGDKEININRHEDGKNIVSEYSDKDPLVNKLDLSEKVMTDCDSSCVGSDKVKSQDNESHMNRSEEKSGVKKLNQVNIGNDSDLMGIQDSDSNMTNCEDQKLKNISGVLKTKTDKMISSPKALNEVQDFISVNNEFKERENKEYVTRWSSESSEEEDEDSWDKMFDEDGECLDPKSLEELTNKVGKVKIKKATIDYYNYQPKDPQLDYDELGHIIEVYDFPAEFTTRDLLTAFQQFSGKGFDIKWVDDTHALAVFASAIAAKDALKMTHPLLKVRCLSESARQCKVKARKCTEFLQPYKPRPETSAVTARRLVTGALGLAPKLSKEQREKERKVLKEAREKKKQDRKQRDDIWEGNYKSDKSMDT